MQIDHNSNNLKPKRKASRFLLTIIIFLFICIVVWERHSFTKYLENSLQNVHSVIDSLRTLESRLASLDRELNQVVATLSSTNTLDKTILVKAHKFIMLKATYAAMAKSKNGADIMPEIEVINKYATGQLAELTADIKNLIMVNKVLANATFISALNGMLSDCGISNATTAPVPTDSSNSSGIGAAISSIVKVEALKTREDKEHITTALKALEYNNIQFAIDELQSLEDEYAALKEILGGMRVKSAINMLLKQITDKIIYDT